MKGITKVIDELGLMILDRDIKLESQQEEIKRLKDKLEAIECYINALEKHIDTRREQTN